PPYRAAVPTDPRHLASSPDPRPAFVEATARPVCRVDDGVVVVGRPTEVVEVLGRDDAVVVVPPVGPGPLAGLVGRMARFTEGTDHASRRAEVEAVLAGVDVSAVRAATCRQVRAVVRD